MADKVVEKGKIPARVFFATVAVAAGLSACKEIQVKDGDTGTVVRATHCWQYPGGKDASGFEAPLGQEDHGMVAEGAQVTFKAKEGEEIFGVKSGTGEFLRSVLTNPGDLGRSIGVVGEMAAEQGLSTPSVPENLRQKVVCWLDSRAISVNSNNENTPSQR